MGRLLCRNGGRRVGGKFWTRCKSGRMKGEALVLYLVLAGCLVAVALPMPLPDGQVSVPRSEVRSLERLESTATRTAAHITQGLEAADSVPVAKPRRMGESRGTSDQERTQYERYMHGTLGVHQNADVKAKAALLREEIAATQDSVRSLEAAAETVLQRDKRVHKAARNIAVASEKRREKQSDILSQHKARQRGFEEGAAADWQRHEAKRLGEVAHGAAKAYYTEGEALALERKMQRSQGKQAGPTINIPAKLLSAEESTAEELKSKTHQMFSEATQLEKTLEHPERLGEPGVTSNTLAKLQRELDDARETKKMLLRDAQSVLQSQQNKENTEMEKTLVGLRQRHHSDAKRRAEKQVEQERSKTHDTEVKSHAKIKQMEHVTAQLMENSKHQFAEFSEILDSSHSTKRHADQKLTDLEAMMIALKTSRSLRLQDDSF